MPSRSRDFVINIKTKLEGTALGKLTKESREARSEMKALVRETVASAQAARENDLELQGLARQLGISVQPLRNLQKETGATTEQLERYTRRNRAADDGLRKMAHTTDSARESVKKRTKAVKEGTKATGESTEATEEATKATADHGKTVEGTAASLSSLVTVKRYATGAWKAFRVATASSRVALVAWIATGVIALKVALGLAESAEEAAQGFKQFEYQTGQSAGSIAQIQRHLKVYGDEVELLTRALQGDEAATRELIARNKEFDDVLRRLTLSSAEFAALDTEGRIQAIAYQLNLSTREAEQLNDEIRDLSDQDAFDPTEWEKLKQEIGDTLSGLGDDASDIGKEIGNKLLDGIAVAITGGEEAPEDSANWLERLLGLDTDVEGAIQPTVDTVTTMSTHLSEALSNSAVGTTSGSWWQNIVATQQEQEELDALSDTLDHLWDRLGAVEDRREAVKNATRWVKENGEAVGAAARAAAGGIALLGKSFDAIKPDAVTRMGLVASAMERLGLTGADIIDNPRLSKLLTDTVTGLGVAATNDPGIDTPAASVPVQGQSGVVDDPDDNDVYDHNYPTDVVV